jgi:WD40 repeat protein
VGKIFISHSSANNAEALAINDWLAEQGWGDVFLDLDPKRGLVAGDRWQAALKAAAEQCELILIMISPEWAKSRWCLAEFLLAKQMNKQILGVLVKPTPIADLPVELTAEWQLVDLSAPDTGWSVTLSPPRFEPETTVSFSGTGLARLRSGLEKAGLDATTFLWPPEHDLGRAPYRGLLPLDQDDAGIFFGRDGAIVLTLDALRGLRNAAAPRFTTILGASGAGKSSFLRAGLLPRLGRDSQHFYVLPIIRPERAALSGEHGFAAMLEAALKARNITRNRADIREAVLAGADAVAPILRDLSAPLDSGSAETAEPPTLVVAVDQAEELLGADNAEAAAFLKLLADLGRRDAPPVLVIFTVRSDSFDQLQSRPELASTQPHHLVDLPPVPAGSFGDIIRGPARRVTASGRKLLVDETLVDALLNDIEQGGTKDALPLLAFTLERLYTDYGADGDLQLSEYDRLGRIRGAIEAAVEQALAKADGNPSIPKDRAARLALLRRGLIPWLAGIDPTTGSPRRRVARLAEVPEEARPLIELMVEQRLLATDIDTATKERTIEPAHEALLRQWGALDGWLIEDSADLGTIEALRRAATEWDANARASEFVIHKGARLSAVEQLAGEERFAAYLTSVDRAYLSTARNVENAAIRKARAARTRLAVAAGIVGVVLVAGGTAGYFVWSAGEAAKTLAAARFDTARSEAALRVGKPEEATRYALAAYETLPDVTTRTAALNAAAVVEPALVALVEAGADSSIRHWRDDHTLAIRSGGTETLIDVDTGAVTTVTVPELPQGTLRVVFDNAGGGTVLFRDGSMTDLDGKLIAGPIGPDFSSRDATTSDDGKVALMVGLIGETLLRDCRTLPCIDAELTAPPDAGQIEGFDVSPDGSRIAALWSGGQLALYDTPSEPQLLPYPETMAPRGKLEEVWMLANDRIAVVQGSDVFAIDLTSGSIDALAGNVGSVFAFTKAGDKVATNCEAGLCVYADGHLIGAYDAHVAPITSFGWSPDGKYLFSTARMEPVHVWSPADPPEAWLSPLRTGSPLDLTSLAIDEERDLVAAGDQLGNIWLWSGSNTVHRYPRPEAIEETAVTSLAFLSDGQLAAVYQNRAIGVLDAADADAAITVVPIENASFSRIAALSGDIRAAVPLTDRRIAVLSGDALRLTLLDADPNALTPWGIAGAGADNTAFISHSDGSIRRRNLGSGEPATTIFDAAQPLCGAAVTTDNNGARSLDMSRDGNWLAATRSDAQIIVHNLADPGRPLCLPLLAPDSRVVSFSPDSKQLAVLSATDRLYAYDLSQSGAPLIMGGQLIPDLPFWWRHPLGQDNLRQIGWLDWTGANEIAIATADGDVLKLALDPAAWRARVDSVFIAP